MMDLARIPPGIRFVFVESSGFSSRAQAHE